MGHQRENLGVYAAHVAGDASYRTVPMPAANTSEDKIEPFSDRKLPEVSVLACLVEITGALPKANQKFQPLAVSTGVNFRTRKRLLLTRQLYQEYYP